MPGAVAALHTAITAARPELAADAAGWLDRSLGTPWPESAGSTLNNDGSPVQLCLTSDGVAVRHVLVVDPGGTVEGADRRHRRSRAVLEAAADSLLDPAGVAVMEATVGANLPASLRGHADLAAGTMWLGVPLARRGLAVYLNGSWGSPADQWDRVVAWLHGAGVDPSTVASSVDAWRDRATVASVGADIAADGGLRLKVYARLRGPAKLTELGDPGWCDPAFARFLRCLMGERGVPPAGLVWCTGFVPGIAAPVDLKVDVCGHCLDASPAWWREVAGRLDHDGAPTPAIDLTDWGLDAHSDVAFAGVGRRLDGAWRTNIYLRGRTSRA